MTMTFTTSDLLNEFPAIAFNDTLMSKVALSYEPTVSPLNDNKVDFRISFDESDDEDYMVIFDKNSFSYKIIYVDDSKSDSENDIDKVDMPSFLSPEPTPKTPNTPYWIPYGYGVPIFYLYGYSLPDTPYLPKDQKIKSFYVLIEFDFAYGASTLEERGILLRFEGLKYTDADIADFEERLRGYTGEDVDGAQGCLGTEFTSRAWRRLFEVQGPLFILGMGLHTTEEMESAGFGEYWAESARQIPNKGDLSAYWVGISFVGDFLGTSPSYTSIRDLMLRLCHRLIACSIGGRIQTPEKGVITNLFYLGGMDVGSVNIPYLLARYLRMFASGRKRGVLTVIVRDLPMIDMVVLVRLQICEELDDTWAWVAPRPERQPDATIGTLEVAKGAQAGPAPVQAPQPPPVAVPAWSLPQRVARLEEEVHGIQGALGEQREVLDSIAHDFSRFATWTVTSLSQMMDHAVDLAGKEIDKVGEVDHLEFLLINSTWKIYRAKTSAGCFSF
ncbi:hypothetical protein Tco_0184580 [Tanacetum coccineum]